MRVIIHRGTKEIGGTCIELVADNGKIIWIDLGIPLDNKISNIDYVSGKSDALLISHPHLDHFGLMENLNNSIPIFIGELSLDLINATKIFRGIPIEEKNFQVIKPWEKFIVDDTFHITPFLTDHSTPEAFAYLIEAAGKRIFYSGDFRGTGRKKFLFEKLIKNPPRQIDLLLIEGTMVERESNPYPTEDSVEEEIFSIVKTQKNVSFVISSAQNIDRFISVFKACKRTEKHLVIDIYTAWVLEMTRKQSKNIPAIEWQEIKVFEHPSQIDKIKDKLFDKFRERIHKQRIDNQLFQNPANFVYFVRSPNEKFIGVLRKHGIINIIYSQWVGYLKEEHKTFSTDLLNLLQNDNGISFHFVHTSGHATVPELMDFAQAINPQQIVPIHTAYPEKFKSEFEERGFTNVALWDDGKEYSI